MVEPATTGSEAARLTASSATEAAEEGAALVQSASDLVAATPGDSSQVLPTVLSEVPVAALLLDLAERQVTYANRAAVAMAGNVPLPVAIEEWSATAELTDLAGSPLVAGDHSLLRIAAGDDSGGGTVQVRAGKGDHRRVMWATGFPLPGLDAGTEMALVILLEVGTGRDRRPGSAHQSVQEQAIVATNIAFTITDPRQADNPLIWVNPAFTQMTGYTSEETVGYNCRFLQGPATDRDEVARLRRCLLAGERATVVLLNYRKDGTAFWNQLAVSPVLDGTGELVSFVGVQTDVTERVRADVERERAHEAERAARQRLALLAEASSVLGSTLDVRDALRRLAELVVPSLGDWVVFTTADKGEVTDVIAHHRDGHEDLLGHFAESYPSGVGEQSAVRAVLESGEPILHPNIDIEFVAGNLTDPDLVEACAVLGVTSAVSVPLLSRRNRILGTLTFISGHSGRVWDRNDLEVAVDLGRRAGLSVDNARLYQQEHRAAETLQRSLLPEVPEVEGLTISARYLPANSAADVGGDFYEVTPLPDGTVGIAVGDVVGHDLAAAAAMGHLRVLLRSIAWDRAESQVNADPAAVLDRTDELVQALAITSMATVFFARLRKLREQGTTWVLSYCNAGHPPGLLRLPDGRVELIGVEADVLLGAIGGVRRSTTEVILQSGTMLIAFTDGLVEVPGLSIDDGLQALMAQVADLGDAGPEEVAKALTATVGDGLRDDIALLAICIN